MITVIIHVYIKLQIQNLYRPFSNITTLQCSDEEEEFHIGKRSEECLNYPRKPYLQENHVVKDVQIEKLSKL